MNIEQGLFKFELTDHHAILGVSLDADAKEIRKRYLKIARRLHPDSLATATDSEKQQASELLSKMVNPAYEKLTQEKGMAEYKVVLRMQGEQLSRRPIGLDIQTEAAKTLLSINDAKNLYTSSLKKLADEQYDSLERVQEVIGQISELNLAYLVSSGGNTGFTAQVGSGSKNSTRSATATPTVTTEESSIPPSPPSPRQRRESIISSYLNRAREFAQKKDYSRAIIELREAVNAHPNSAPCHSQLAALYLQVGQQKMARIHLKRALDIDPNNAFAQELEPRINQNEGKNRRGASGNSASKSRGGLFGLFGGRQK